MIALGLATLAVLLTVRPIDSDAAPVPLLLGMLAGVALAAPLLTLAWVAGGGRLLGLAIGLGNPVRSWLTRRGTYVFLARLPITLYGSGGVGGRSFARLPHLTYLVGAALILAAGLMIGIGTTSAVVDGIVTGAALFVFLALATPVGNRNWRALSRSFSAAAARTMDEAQRAGAAQDSARVLDLTATIPVGASPQDVDILHAMRAEALMRAERYDDAVRLLRADLLDQPPAAVNSRRRLALAAVLIAAWEAGDDVGLPARSELPGLLAGSFPGMLPDWVGRVRTAALLVGGDPLAAYEGAETPARRLPRQLQAWPLCTMARAAIELGRPDEARTLLTKARALDPAEPRLKYAFAALDT